MTPADLVKADRLADLVCHDKQMNIWEDDVLGELAEFLELPDSFEEMMRLRESANRAIKRLVASAFSHPEILGLPSRKNPT